MKTKAKMFLARLLMVFSVVFIGIGVSLTLFNNEKVLHPVNDTTVVYNTDNEVISITTTASDEENESIVENNVSSTNLPSDSTTNSNTVSPSTNNNQPSSNSNTNSNASSNDTVTKEEQATVTPSVDEVNAELRKQMEETYGVTIKYQTETAGYSVGGMSTTAISDSNVAQTALVNLNLALSLYPSGFFKEIKDKGYPLTFYLIKRYSTDNVTGVTDSSKKNIVISIATDYDFADTFHHEVYHYIEKYMTSAGASFTSWNSLNPADFSYGVIDSAYSYARTFSEDAFFVNSYAMTDQYEDRASTFEYMMKSSKASCLNYGKTVWLKARTMCEQIDYFLNTVTPTVTEYWERHIY